MQCEGLDDYINKLHTLKVKISRFLETILRSIFNSKEVL